MEGVFDNQLEFFQKNITYKIVYQLNMNKRNKYLNYIVLIWVTVNIFGPI
jgi:hypothetical protein